PSRAPRSPGRPARWPGAPGLVCRGRRSRSSAPPKIREVFHHDVFRAGEVTRRADVERQEVDDRAPFGPKRSRELERRTGQTLEPAQDAGGEKPQGRGGQLTTA